MENYVQNKTVIAILNWSNKHRDNLFIHQIMRMFFAILTGVFCFLAVVYLPTNWGWGMVAGQLISYAVIAKCAKDIVCSASGWRPDTVLTYFANHIHGEWRLKLGRGIWTMMKITGYGLLINLAGVVLVGIVGGIIVGAMWMWSNFLAANWFPTLCAIGGVLVLFLVIKAIIMTNEARKINKMITAWHPKGTSISDKVAALIQGSEKSTSLLVERNNLAQAVEAMSAKMLEGSVTLVPRGGKPSHDSVHALGISLEETVRAQHQVIPKQKVDAALYQLREKERARIQAESKKKEPAAA